MSISQRVYQIAPRFIERILVNIEALKRNRFRRYGDYEAMLSYYDPTWHIMQTLDQQRAYQLERLNVVLGVAKNHVPHYRATLPAARVSTLEEFSEFPILDKDTVRANPQALVHEQQPINKLWACSSSGSTGTPLRFYAARDSVRAHTALLDGYYAMHGCRFGERRVRISGLTVVPYAQTEPPFWIYIDHYSQLQCSAYHLSPCTYRSYLKAMRETKVTYGTGYASAWHLLAMYILESSETPPRLKAIFTDSEGLSLEQQTTVEQAFRCPVFQTYGLGEAEMVAMQCHRRRYHVLTRTCIAEILDDNNRPVGPGETGEIIVTDLTALTVPIIRYRTGDLATLAASPCDCGWQSLSWTTVVGRTDDRIKTPEGRWIRVGGHIIRPGVGVRESQIVQTAPDRVVIRVVADSSFVPASMDDVIAAAHRYLGRSMQVTWEIVGELPRMPSGKLRHVVREIDT